MTPPPLRPAEVTGALQTDQVTPGTNAQEKAAETEKINRSTREKIYKKDENKNSKQSGRLNIKNMKKAQKQK